MARPSLIRSVVADIAAGVRFERIDGGVDVIRLEATADLVGHASGRFAEPATSVEFDLDVSDNVEFLGFAFTQFALPVLAGPSLDFDFEPAHNLKSPAAMLPLLARDGERSVLLAPLTNPHEQIITVRNGAIHWGWHGDLDEIPAGFATELGIFEGTTPSELLTKWGLDLQRSAGVERPSRSANPVTSHLSYWTDNGAAYWYRTEPDLTIVESIADTVAHLHDVHVPVRAIELDSWFYQHEVSRPISDIGYPDVVPPSGAMSWTPRLDAFPTSDAAIEGSDDIGTDTDTGPDPIAEFAERLDRPPLILHARHISPRSPYVGDGWWVDEFAAHPSDPAFFRQWFDDADRWGAVCIEQDWMLMYWFGVRELRSSPGRAAAWQRSLNEHARATGVDLMWCMATPADLIAAVEFDRVIAVRTSDDYRFAEDPALLWTWFLTVNRLVEPLGLWPFKDCFFSNPNPDDGDSISGDTHAELEALLSAMSGGPVGLGDRIGRTNRNIVMRTCDDDGRLLQPDAPIGLIDDCLFGSPARGERLAWAMTHTTIGETTWTYVVAINTATEPRTIADTLELAEVGLVGSHDVYDWRSHTGTHGDTISVELVARDWALFVCCPPGADIGETAKYVTTPSRR